MDDLSRILKDRIICNYFERMWKTLRKFGLDYDDFPTIMENVNNLLRILTIDIFKNTKPIFFISYIFTAIGIIIYFYVYVFSMVWLVYFYYGRAGNWTAVAVVLSLFFGSISGFTKLIFMKLYAKVLRKTVQKYLLSNAQVVPGTRFSRNLRKRLRIVKRRATCFWLFGIVNGAIYALIPFMTPGRHFTSDLYLIYGLVPMFESPNYEIATAINTFTIAFGIYTLLSISAYVFVIAGYIECQMQALSEELKNVWKDSLNFYNVIKHNIRNKVYVIDVKKEIMNEFIRVRLRDIIKFHNITINLSHEVDQELRPLMVLEFSFMALSIIAELLGGLENTYLQLSYTILLVFMDCLAGQRLIDACNNFETALYICQWENFNVANQKTVLLMLRISKKTLILSVGGVAKLNFECLMMILRSTYSAYTTLTSTLN